MAMQKACSETKKNFDELKISGLTKNHLNYFYNLSNCLEDIYVCLLCVCMCVCMYPAIIYTDIHEFVNNCSGTIRNQKLDSLRFGNFSITDGKHFKQ